MDSNFQRHPGLILGHCTHDRLAHSGRVSQRAECLCNASRVVPLSITLDTAGKGFRTLAPWNVTRLDMSPHGVVRCELLLSVLPGCQSFHLQGPRIVVPSLSLLTVSNRHSANTTDSPAPESTVISGYRPRSPSVATGLRSIDMLPNVTAFRSTSSSRHSPSLELSLGRSSPSLEMSCCGAVIGRRWYTSRSSLRGNLSHRAQTSVCFVPKDPCVAKRQAVPASYPNNQRMDPLLYW